MIASKTTHHALLFAAHHCGVRAHIVPLSSTGHRFRVKLYPDTTGLSTPSGRRKRRNGSPIPARYQRTSASGFHPHRFVHAVCWHGFRDYFRKVFEYAPDTVFNTALETWRGSADFENRYRYSKYHNVGSKMAPMQINEVCTCQDEE